MTTFASLGIPFRLFEAATDEASGFLGQATCSLCSEPGFCFELGIGADVIVACDGCGTANALDADDREGAPCRACQRDVPFPDLGDDDIACCYACLRGGRAALTQDTELGMVRWEDAQVGLTHGVPGGPKQAGWETVAGEDDWLLVRVDADELRELVRTPSWVTWQGERWLFCCKRVMVFIGGWTPSDFAAHAEDNNGARAFEGLIDDGSEALWHGLESGHVSTYLFRCAKCGRHRGYCDFD